MNDTGLPGFTRFCWNTDPIKNWRAGSGGAGLIVDPWGFDAEPTLINLNMKDSPANYC